MWGYPLLAATTPLAGEGRAARTGPIVARAFCSARWSRFGLLQVPGRDGWGPAEAPAQLWLPLAHLMPT